MLLDDDDTTERSRGQLMDLIVASHTVFASPLGEAAFSSCGRHSIIQRSSAQRLDHTAINLSWTALFIQL